MDEEKIKTEKTVSPPEKNVSGVSLSPTTEKKVGTSPNKPSAPPKPPKAPLPAKPEAQKQDKKPDEKSGSVQGVDNKPTENVELKNGDAGSQLSLEEEIEIARLQCEDDDNAGAVLGEDEVIEKSYKAGLSDQDKQRKKRKLRRLLLLLLLLLLLGGTVSATYFIIKNKTEYVPEFYDNVAISMDFNMERSEDRMPGDNLILIRPVEVLVNANTEEINYDIVALGIKVTAKFTDSGEDCSNIIDVGIYDINQIYRTDELEFTGDSYIRCGKDIMLYYKKVLEPGQNEKLINSIRINTSTPNEYAQKEITVKVEVFAVYPNPVQIRADTSDFKDAPQGWVEEVYEKMNNIFRERAKNKSIFS